MTVLSGTALVLLSSCGAASKGDTAYWDLRPENSPTEAGNTITAYVSRLGCNGGVTGKVLKPSVKSTATKIVVTFRVAAVSGGFATCPSNQAVPVVVDIGEPIGRRVLVDGACGSGGEATSTAACRDGGIRWNP